MNKKRFSMCLIFLGWTAMAHAALQMEGPKDDDDPLGRDRDTAGATESGQSGSQGNS